MPKICNDFKFYLNTYKPDLIYEYQSIKAAVLVPLLDTKEGLNVLFEVRSSDLKWQPGEICFPGGKIENTDKTPQDTAIRETCEELGINSEQIEIYGALDYLATQMGVLVYPFVGKILQPEKIQPSEQEVKEYFTIPLRDLLDMQPICTQVQVLTKPADDDFPYELLTNYKKEPKMRKKYPVYFYPCGEYIIWGMTARILKDFLDIYKKSCLT